MQRLATWLVTGPLGHLAAGVLDWAELFGRYWWARARGRPIGNRLRRFLGANFVRAARVCTRAARAR